MVRIKNMKELEDAVSAGLLEPLFLSKDAGDAAMEAIRCNLDILVQNYKSEGAGGYLCLLTDEFRSAQEEYLAELGKYNLSPDDYEYDSIIATCDGFELHTMLFILTEYHLLFVYKKYVG